MPAPRFWVGGGAMAPPPPVVPPASLLLLPRTGPVLQRAWRRHGERGVFRGQGALLGRQGWGVCCWPLRLWRGVFSLQVARNLLTSPGLASCLPRFPCLPPTQLLSAVYPTCWSWKQPKSVGGEGGVCVQREDPRWNCPSGGSEFSMAWGQGTPLCSIPPPGFWERILVGPVWGVGAHVQSS